MKFNDLLSQNGIDPKNVALALHRERSEALNRAICVLAGEDAAAFYAFQSTHPKIQEATLSNRPYLASFVPGRLGEFQFVGLFARELGPITTRDELENDFVFKAMLKKFSNRPEIDPYIGRVRFLLNPLDQLSELRGRLVIEVPIARNYMRLADTTELTVSSIKKVARLTPPIPPWNECAFVSADFASLPRDWATTLSSWRGVYLIVDQSDGARYVGSAYGKDNILGRWQTHAAGKFGVTKELKKRLSENFRYSILQLLAPDAESNDVIALERNWMMRLDTIENGLNT